MESHTDREKKVVLRGTERLRSFGVLGLFSLSVGRDLLSDTSVEEEDLLPHFLRQ